MSGIQMVLMNSGGPSVVNPLTPASVAASGSGVSNTITFQSAGNISSTYNVVPPVWFSPTQAGIGSNYWIKVTVTSGTLTNNAAATWTSLSGNPFVTETTAGLVSKSVIFTVQIASDAAGSNIVMTSTGWEIDLN